MAALGCLGVGAMRAAADPTDREMILRALGGAHAGVLATLEAGQLRQRTVYFGFDDTLSIYFTALAPSAKAAQIAAHPAVSFLVVRDDPDPAAVEQVVISGDAQVLEDPDERRRCLTATARSAGLVRSLMAAGQTARLECMRIVPKRVEYRRHGDIPKGVPATVLGADQLQ